MTASRIALNTLSSIINRAAKLYGVGSRAHRLAEQALRELVCGATKYVVNLSLNEQYRLAVLGFSIELILSEARGKKDLCEVTIR